MPFSKNAPPAYQEGGGGASWRLAEAHVFLMYAAHVIFVIRGSRQHHHEYVVRVTTRLPFFHQPIGDAYRCTATHMALWRFPSHVGNIFKSIEIKKQTKRIS